MVYWEPCRRQTFPGGKPWLEQIPQKFPLRRKTYNLEEAINQMWKIIAGEVTIEKAYADRDAARAAIRDYISELEGVREG